MQMTPSFEKSFLNHFQVYVSTTSKHRVIINLGYKTLISLAWHNEIQIQLISL